MVKLVNRFTNRFEMSERRLAICKDCEFFDQIFRKCNRCGCFMDAKTLWAKATCPVGKWLPEENLNTPDNKEESP